MGAVDVWLMAETATGEQVKYATQKAARFAWRAGRNLLCATPWGRNLLFPAHSLANRFGRGDADYALSVFMHHNNQLTTAGFQNATRILEVGPGRNLGTSMLMWALNNSRTGQPVTMFLWDVFPNMIVNKDSMAEVAHALLESPSLKEVTEALPEYRIDQCLGMIARGEIMPDIRYRVQPLSTLVASGEVKNIELVYSQAAIEHIWHIEAFWRAVISLTKPGGWHSHRIDLADHGRRNTNYIEMLEWSSVSYWLTMRFIPGAINRWRASAHLDYLTQSGMNIFSVKRVTQDTLPILRRRINQTYISLDDVDLRTTAIDLVAVKAI